MIRRSYGVADLAIVSGNAIESDVIVGALEVDPRTAKRTGSGPDRENDHGNAIDRASVTGREKGNVSARGNVET